VNRASLRLLLQKELRETLRDRRTLRVRLFVPIFLYPALPSVMQQLAPSGQRQLEEGPVSVLAQGRMGS
jgi:sodium transport system permease protein